MLAIFRYSMNEGKTPPSWKEAIISITPKEGRDTELCSSYSSISMLHFEYKVYTSIISKRFESFMPDIIDEDQTG